VGHSVLRATSSLNGGRMTVIPSEVTFAATISTPLNKTTEAEYRLLLGTVIKHSMFLSAGKES
jgi:hypothetical protein